MATEIITSFLRLTDENGLPLSGGLVYVYDVGTTTPKTVYSNAGLSVSAANPIVCDAYGLHDMHYVATGSYKIVVKTSAAVTVYTRDNIDGRVPVGAGALAIANGGTGATDAAAALSALGGVDQDTFTELSTQVASIAGSLASTEGTQIATGTTAQRDATPSEGLIRDNTTLGQLEGYILSNWRQISVAPPVAGGFKNLSIANNSSTPTTKIDLSADAVTVETTNEVAFRVTSLSVTIDTAGTGANGMDAGALGNSAWYAVWAIYNPTTDTAAGLVSSSASSPTMPAGYTAKARLGWFRTDGSAQFLNIAQKGRRAAYTTTTFPTVTSGSSGGGTVSISNFVPTTATSIFVSVKTGNSTVLVGPNSTNTGQIALDNSVVNAPSMTTAAEIFLAGTTIYYAATNITTGTPTVYATGWSDNI